MIQRIQSIWLFLAALVMAGIFYFPLYKFSGVPTTAGLTIGTDFFGIILAVLSMVLSVFTLIRFKNRKSQIGLCWLNILVTLGLQFWLFYGINRHLATPAYSALNGYYWIGIFLPLVTLVFLFLAKAGIKKDEKLVKSLDRLR